MKRSIGFGFAVLILIGLAGCMTKPIAPDVPMVLIPAGPFIMGSEDSGQDEQPKHTVTLDGFLIDQYEVTNARYEECVGAGACNPPSRMDSETRPKYFGEPEFANYPVIGVTWSDAQAYCEWRGARLPTEAEWEKAARGTDGRIFPWGNTFDPARLNYCDRNCADCCGIPWANAALDDGYADTAPVDAFPQGISPYGACNMAGNVWEWVADWYSPDYYQSSPTENPSGPSEGQQRVIRGGGIFEEAYYTRTSVRRRFTPGVSSTSVGFRCARSP